MGSFLARINQRQWTHCFIFSVLPQCMATSYHKKGKAEKGTRAERGKCRETNVLKCEVLLLLIIPLPRHPCCMYCSSKVTLLCTALELHQCRFSVQQSCSLVFGSEDTVINFCIQYSVSFVSHTPSAQHRMHSGSACTQSIRNWSMLSKRVKFFFFSSH